MANEIFTNGKLQQVFYDWGNFGNRNTKRFLKAPFDLVDLNGEFGVMPCAPQLGIGIGPQGIGPLASDSTDDEFYECANGGFLSDGNQIVIGMHELGDYKNPKAYDTWKGVHQFGILI